MWIAFALMTAATVLALVWPLASRRAASAGPGADVRFYAELLREVDGDIERGAVDATEAQATRAEIGRRLLASARPGSAVEGGLAGFRGRRLAATGAALVLVPMLSLALYLHVGHPGQPDEPLAARADAPSDDVAAAVAKIEAHLATHPEDGRGFEVIAPVYLRMGRADDAVRAYRAAIAALGDTAEREASLGQAMAMAADGVVTAETRAVFDKALALDPKLPQARFFVALAAEQDGDKARAIGLWQALLADSPPDAPWRASVEQHVATASGQAQPGAPSGPAAAAIAALPSDQRLQAIRGMVEGLASRLAQNGRDVEGWLRLIKAYSVLGDSEKARTALSDARRGLADDPSDLARIEAAARELGLEG